METAQFIGIIVGVCVVLGLIGKFLLADWHAKGKELEALKESNTATALMRLERDVSEFRGASTSLKMELEAMKGRLDRSDNKSEYLAGKLDNAIREISETQKRIDISIKAAVKTEIIELSQNAKLYREKKGNDGKS